MSDPVTKPSDPWGLTQEQADRLRLAVAVGNYEGAQRELADLRARVTASHKAEVDALREALREIGREAAGATMAYDEEELEHGAGKSFYDIANRARAALQGDAE